MFRTQKQTKTRIHYSTRHSKHSTDKSSNGCFSPRKKTVLSLSRLYHQLLNFFDISQLPDKLSTAVVIHAKHLFSKYGITKVVISDNGPEFTANTFKTFSKQWDFKNTISSPHTSKSNGQIERTIQTIKKNVKKY